MKSFRRDRAAPRCYLSHVPEQAGWAAVLAQDLREAGVRVLTGIGELTGADLALVVSSPAYRKAWQSPGGPLRAELPVLRDRMRDGQGILELTRAGDDAAFDFRDDTRYPVVLFDLVLTLYAIPWSNPVFAAIRHGLREQHGTGPSLRAAAKVFVSYAHEDEPFKDALGTMLSLLQRQGVLEFWHDRRIEPGASWRAGIEAAAAECDMAILLVSPDFLASSFIQDEELPTLLRRRLTVVPVIVRPCPWADHPALAGLQALPRDARPVITFPAETGARDQAWTDVVAEIRARLIG